MKLSVNNRKSNIQEFELWLNDSSFNLVDIPDNICTIVQGYAEYLVTLRNPFKDKTSKRFERLVRYKVEHALKVVAATCYKHGIQTTIGHVYIISNPSFVGWVKIGSSIDAESRLVNYQTYSPFRDFILERSLIVLDASLEEQNLLLRFPNRRNEWVPEEDMQDIEDIFRRLREQTVEQVLGL